MASPIFLYPVLSDETKNGLKVQSRGWTVYYHNSDGDISELSYKSAEINDSLNCIETDGKWDPDSYDLCLSKTVLLSHFRGLFGPDGIVCRNAEIGISAVWTSVESRQRGAFKIGTFSVTDDDYKTDADLTSDEFNINIEFPVAKLRGDVDFSINIFVSKPGVPDEDEIHLANENGFVLGEIDSFSLRLDGTGSMFPVYESDDNSKPLWYIICNWVDPLSDSFSDNVSVFLNRAHKSYKFIDQTKGTFCRQLLVETMSAAICCIVEEARNSEFWDQILSDDSCERGSVAEAFRYFRDTLGWDYNSATALSESVRKFFDGRMAD